MSTPIAAPVAPQTEALAGDHAPAAAGLPAAVPKVRERWARRGSVALAILATVAVVFALDWAQSLFISLLLGILLAYTLNPLVIWLERLGIPRVLGTSSVMVAVVCALAFGTYSLRAEMQTILDQVPEAVRKVSAGLASVRQGQASTVQKMQTAAREIENATSHVTGTTSPLRQPATRVVIDTPGFQVGNMLLAGSRGAAGVVAQAAMVLFLTFFLLLSGDTYKRKLVRLTGPSLSNRKITVHILGAINESIQRYLLMLLATNVLVGLLTWIALRWIGLENDGAWGVAAGLLHLIPYVGSAIAAAAIGMAVFIQFDSLSTALLVAGASLAIATLVGTFVTTWMSGRIAKMNTAAVFVSLLFWTWLWGVWGMLLSFPITVIVKVVAQHVEPHGPLAELLAD